MYMPDILRAVKEVYMDLYNGAWAIAMVTFDVPRGGGRYIVYT